MKKILITGKNSYVGTSVQSYIREVHPLWVVDELDMLDETWNRESFSEYDVVFHVAGIAHVSTDPSMEELYYRVNRDLTIAVAKKAKEEKVKQFIFMSSIIVYGDSRDRNIVITMETEPQPNNFYGHSKLEAEQGLNALETEDFNVAVVRPPMIYGPGCKGNYQTLSKFAGLLRIIPKVDNQRSMIHVRNLASLIVKLVENRENGLFFPQNKEYVNTSNLIKTINAVNKRTSFIIPGFGWLLLALGNKVSVIRKAFGSLVYDKAMSKYKEDYNILKFEESIKNTEIKGD